MLGQRGADRGDDELRHGEIEPALQEQCRRPALDGPRRQRGGTGGRQVEGGEQHPGPDVVQFRVAGQPGDGRRGVAEQDRRWNRGGQTRRGRGGEAALPVRRSPRRSPGAGSSAGAAVGADAAAADSRRGGIAGDSGRQAFHRLLHRRDWLLHRDRFLRRGDRLLHRDDRLFRHGRRRGLHATDAGGAKDVGPAGDAAAAAVERVEGQVGAHPAAVDLPLRARSGACGSSAATTGSSATTSVAELAATQSPPSHTSPAAHLVLQSPQKFGSVSVAAQKPPDVLRHLANPYVQTSPAR